MIDCSERLSAFVVLTRGGCCVSNFDLSNSLPQRGRGTAERWMRRSFADLLYGSTTYFTRAIPFKITILVNFFKDGLSFQGRPPHPPRSRGALVAVLTLEKAYAKRDCLQFCSREKDFSATDKDAPQLNLSLPQGRGRGTASAVDEDAPYR